MATSGRRLTPDEERELIRLRCLGWSVRKVARHLDLDKETVHKYAPQWLVDEWNTRVMGESAPLPSIDIPQDLSDFPRSAL